MTSPLHEDYLNFSTQSEEKNDVALEKKLFEQEFNNLNFYKEEETSKHIDLSDGGDVSKIEIQSSSEISVVLAKEDIAL